MKKKVLHKKLRWEAIKLDDEGGETVWGSDHSDVLDVDLDNFESGGSAISDFVMSAKVARQLKKKRKKKKKKGGGHGESGRGSRGWFQGKD